MHLYREYIEQIENKLKANADRIESYRVALYQQHKERNERLAAYSSNVVKIIDSIIRPRMEILADYFDNASITLTDPKQAAKSQCNSVFEITPQFPASVSFGFSIFPDVEIETMYIVCNLEILPVFVKYDKKETLTLESDSSDTAQIESWVETRILYFLDTYFQLTHIKQYQIRNLVFDPVCGIQVNKALVALTALYESNCYYFCSVDCHDKFLAETTRYSKL